MGKQIDREKLAALNVKFRKHKYLSILLALFTLGVNIFAWFAFSSSAGLQLDATVASWDVEFKDNGVVSRNIYIEITKMKPGMTTYEKTVEVDNNSEVPATFRYEVISVTLLGNTLDLTQYSNIDTHLRQFYPFSIQYAANKTSLAGNDSLEFNVQVSWPYESNTPQYFSQDDVVYDFNESFIYYLKNGTNYEETTIANETAFTNQKSNLYLIKDDADSYFGMACGSYEKATGEPCLTMNMRLYVEQVN